MVHVGLFLLIGFMTALHLALKNIDRSSQIITISYS